MTCDGALCTFVPGGLVGSQSDVWDQKLGSFTFSSSSYASARVSFPEMILPDDIDGDAYLGVRALTSEPGVLVGCGTASELVCQ